MIENINRKVLSAILAMTKDDEVLLNPVQVLSEHLHIEKHLINTALEQLEERKYIQLSKEGEVPFVLVQKSI